MRDLNPRGGRVTVRDAGKVERSYDAGNSPRDDRAAVRVDLRWLEDHVTARRVEDARDQVVGTVERDSDADHAPVVGHVRERRGRGRSAGDDRSPEWDHVRKLRDADDS